MAARQPPRAFEPALPLGACPIAPGPTSIPALAKEADELTVLGPTGSVLGEINCQNFVELDAASGKRVDGARKWPLSGVGFGPSDVAAAVRSS